MSEELGVGRKFTKSYFHFSLNQWFPNLENV